MMAPHSDRAEGGRDLVRNVGASPVPAYLYPLTWPLDLLSDRIRVTGTGGPSDLGRSQGGACPPGRAGQLVGPLAVHLSRSGTTCREPGDARGADRLGLPFGLGRGPLRCSPHPLVRAPRGGPDLSKGGPSGGGPRPNRARWRGACAREEPALSSSPPPRPPMAVGLGRSPIASPAQTCPGWRWGTLRAARRRPVAVQPP
jgi:hypothetical protein